MCFWAWEKRTSSFKRTSWTGRRWGIRRRQGRLRWRVKLIRKILRCWSKYCTQCCFFIRKPLYTLSSFLRNRAWQVESFLFEWGLPRTPEGVNTKTEPWLYYTNRLVFTARWNVVGITVETQCSRGTSTSRCWGIQTIKSLVLGVIIPFGK